MVNEYSTPEKPKKQAYQLDELTAIASQEQLNVLQPLIYDDPFLTETMDINHRASRMTNGWLSPKFKVVYSAAPQTNDPDLEAVFDAPASVGERFSIKTKSLPNSVDRMGFVEQIAKKFDTLMRTRRPYMEAELKKITRWMNA